MKIYEIGTGYTPIPAQISAATEIIIEELSLAFLEKKPNVSVVDIKSANRAKTDLDIIEVSVPKFLCGTDVSLGIMHKLKRVIYSLKLALKLASILKQTSQKTVFHFHNQYNMFFFLKTVPKRLRQKCVTAYTNHNGVWRMNWEEAEEIIKKRYFQETECMKQTDIIFLLNEETKVNLVKQIGISEEKIVVLNNGVNVCKYSPASNEEKIKAQIKWGIEDRKMILQVGSICDNKGQLRSLKYLLPLMQKNKNIVYGYAGGVIDAEYKKQIDDFAKKNGLEDRIKYFGMVSPGEELATLYRSAYLTIFPSVYEAFGLVVVESLASGIPVLCDEDAVFKFGNGCIYYNEKNIVDILENAIKHEDEYKDFCEKARETATQKYSWEQVSKQYISVFEKL